MPADNTAITIADRFRRLCEMQQRRWDNMPPPEKDRLLQSHLAAARGPRRNFMLLCKMTDDFLPARRERLVQETQK